jgi:hypothetical protein
MSKSAHSGVLLNNVWRGVKNKPERDTEAAVV